MLTLRQRLDYFLDAFRRRNVPIVCPSCGRSSVNLVDKKYLFTRLFECQGCRLNFRHPPEQPEASADFYQREYKQPDGITTDLPSDNEIAELRRTKFAGYPERSIYRLQPVLDQLYPGRKRLKVLDYGCSWGYMTYQFQESGHEVEGFEISEPRAAFGRQSLGITIHTRHEDLADDYDLFFSSHVIEHVPNPAELLAFGRTRVRDDGYCLILCPNGSRPYRQKHPQEFHRLWGRVHPHLPTAEFFARAFSANPFFIATSDAGRLAIDQWDRESQAFADGLDGWEIMVVARPGRMITSESAVRQLASASVA